MANLLIRRLEIFAPLPRADRDLLEEVIRRPECIEAHKDFAREDEAPGDVPLSWRDLPAAIRSSRTVAARS
jgi:hypothetical protein